MEGLAARLEASNSAVQELERQCNQYKSDCVTAVHLLQCQPSDYVLQRTSVIPVDLRQRLGLPELSADLESGQESGKDAAETQKKLVTVASVSTFPPMAVYFDEVEEEAAETPVTMRGDGGLTRSESAQAALVERLGSLRDYQVGSATE